MKYNHEYKSRFRILKGGKISLVVSALLVGASITAPAFAATLPNITSNITVVQDMNASTNDSLTITPDGNLSVSGPASINIINNGSITIENNGIIDTTTTTPTGDTGPRVTDSAAGIDGKTVIGGNILNTANGIISVQTGVVVSSDDTATSGDAKGIFIDGNITNNSTIENNGSLSVISGGSNALTTSVSGDVVGIDVGGSINDSNLTNSGTITTTSGRSSGYNTQSTTGTAIGIRTANLTNATIENNNAITATGGYSDSYNGNAVTSSVTGIESSNLDNSSILNSGTITVNSSKGISYYGNIFVNGSTVGISVRNLLTNNSTITNSSNITVTSTSSEAYGIKINHMNSNSSINNSGTITATATSRSAYGMYAYQMSGTSSINNSGTITATATSGDAYGINVYEMYGESSIDNSGIITATSTSGDAYGIRVYEGGMDQSSIINSNTILADSTSGKAYGIHIYYLENDSNITNSGTIRATIAGDLSKDAYSLYIDSSTSTYTSITNSSTGKLYGNLNITGDVLFSNAGLISLPSNANNAYVKNFTNTSTGTLQVGLQTDGTTTTHSKLTTTDATFEDGSTIDVNVLSDSTNIGNIAGERLNNVVTASNSLTINGTLNITDNSALLNFELIDDANSIQDDTIDLNVVEGSSIIDSTISGGGDTPAQAAATTLTTINDNIGSHPEMTSLITELNALSTDQEVAAAVESTTPQITSATAGATTQISNGIAGIVEQRQEANIGGLNSGDAMFASKNVWLKTYGSFGKQKDENGLNGFDVNTYGLGMGIDGEYKDNQNIGVALFYTRANVDVNHVAQSSNLDVFTTLVYGNVPIIDDKTNFLYQLGYAWQQTDSTRNLFTGQTARADYTSTTASLDLELMRDYEVNKKLLLQPIVSATYRHFDNPSYSETDAGSNGLNVNAYTSNEFLLGVGTLLHYKLDKDSKIIGNAKIDYDVKGDNATVTSAYQGAAGVTFDTNGIDNGRWNYQAGIGYERTVKEGHNIKLAYDYQGEGTGFSNNVISARYIYSF